MKSLKIFFLTALVAVAALFTACTKDQDWSAGEQVPGAQVYFADGVATNVTVEAETSSFEVTVMRGNVDEAVTVPLKVAVSAANVDEEADPINYAELFTVPANVSFGAGKDSAKFTVSFDRASLEDGQTYTLTFSINDMSAITPYGYDKQTWTLVVPEPLVLLGTGYWTDDVVGPLFGLNATTYPVEVYENLKTPGYIYLKDLYTNAFKQTLIDEFGIAEESIPTWETSYFAINVEDPTAVEIPGQYTGLDIGDGDMAIWSLATGTLENGIISFPTKGLAVQDNDGAYYANNDGGTKLYMPGTPMTDFSLELAYGGFRVAEDNATVYPIARAAYGEDVAEIQYAFVAGDITKDVEALTAALAGIEDGSVVSNKVPVTIAGEDEETGEPILEMTLESVEGAEPGVFTVIAIPYSADGEAQYGDLAFTSFYVQGVGATETPEVDFTAEALPFTVLFPYEQYGISDANGLAWYAEGSEIKTLVIGLWADADIEAILAEGFTIEDIAAAGEAKDPTQLNENGYAGGGYIDLDPETGYTFVFYVENIYGNTAIVTASGTTAADAAASKLTWNTPNVDMSKASVKSYSRISLK